MNTFIRIAFLTLPVVIATVSAVGQVRTDAGLVQGVQADGLVVYKGVPFAAPPIGSLRWREPQPAKHWNGVRLADTFAPACLQSGVSMPGETPPPTSEDCLYLNIWAPASHHKRLPVMVWIHGGGFTSGTAAMPLYWGDRLARKGIIVVTIAYRLGPFGFLVHPELRRESPHHTSGNYGHLDQIAALKWIQRNISAFGGDSHRVTIAGQSAGGSSVSILMSSPLANGLFQRVIAESGAMFEPLQLAPSALAVNAERQGESYVKSLGAHSIADLRAMPAADLLKGEAGNVSHPVIEPYVLPDSPYNQFVAGRQNDAAILVGSNANEYRALIANLDKVKASTFTDDITDELGALPSSLFAAYPHATDEEAKTSRLGLERDIRFGWDMWTWARLQAAKGKHNVFYYHFTHKPPFPEGSVKAEWGASHYAELWYTFDHLYQETWAWTDSDRRLADSMSTYWANFVKSGNPNSNGLPIWPKFTSKEDSVLYLGDPIHVGGVANLKPLQAVDAVYSQVRGAAFGAPPKH